jgi:orotidine-5'-phosphate decarboxylase
MRACRDKGSPVCVGLDPVYEKLPAAVRSAEDLDDLTLDASELERRAMAIHDYCSAVIELIADLVPCVKLQSACFERYRTTGVEVYHELVQQSRDAGLLVIGDCKRGDIGISAEHYAAAELADVPADLIRKDEPSAGSDALTINAYLGADGIEPFMKVCGAQKKGLFALVRTSNPSGDAIQSLKLTTGDTVAEAVARIIAQIGDGDVGSSGYSALGAVVGATKAADAKRLRELMPRQIFLVPGFGAQGGSADDVKACFNTDKRGAIITASRSVIFAYERDTAGPWIKAVERATMAMKKEVNAAIGF